MKEQREKPLILGKAGVVEELVRQGRSPTFSEPVTIFENGKPRVRIPCIIPGADREEPTEILLYPPSATQIMQRIKHVQTSLAQSARV